MFSAKKNLDDWISFCLSLCITYADPIFFLSAEQVRCVIEHWAATGKVDRLAASRHIFMLLEGCSLAAQRPSLCTDEQWKPTSKSVHASWCDDTTHDLPCNWFSIIP